MLFTHIFGHSAFSIIDECGRPANEPNLISCFILYPLRCFDEWSRIESLLQPGVTVFLVRCPLQVIRCPSLARRVGTIDEIEHRRRHGLPHLRLAESTHVPDRAFPNPWANGKASQSRSLVPSHIRLPLPIPVMSCTTYFKSSAAWKLRLHSLLYFGPSFLAYHARYP